MKLSVAFRAAARRELVEAAAWYEAQSRFPYSVYYRRRSGRVIVLAVFHGSRDPRV